MHTVSTCSGLFASAPRVLHDSASFRIVLLIDHDVSVYIHCCMGVPFECNYQVILFIGECARAIFSGSITIMF